MAGCINCKDSLKNCASILSSTCTVYSADYFPKFFTKPDCTVVNINELFKQYGEKIDKLIDDNDVSKIDSGCIIYDKNSIVPKKLHEIELSEICSLKSQVNDLKTIVNNSDVGGKLITIDLRCFKSENAPCQVDTDTYTLLTVLNIILDKLCDHEQRILNLE